MLLWLTPGSIQYDQADHPGQRCQLVDRLHEYCIRNLLVRLHVPIVPAMVPKPQQRDVETAAPIWSLIEGAMTIGLRV